MGGELLRRLAGRGDTFQPAPAAPADAAGGGGKGEKPGPGAAFGLVPEEEMQALREEGRAQILRRLPPDAMLRRGDPETERRISQILSEIVDRKYGPGDMPIMVRRELVARLLDDLIGYGPLEPFLKDPEVTEIMVNRFDRIAVEKGGRLVETDAKFRDEKHLRDIIERMLGPTGRHVDDASPIVNARLPDGSRLNAIIPPVGVRGSALNIRKHRKPFTEEELVRLGTLTPDAIAVLKQAVQARLNIVVSGGTGSGKCLDYSAPVLLADGKRIPIGEIVEDTLKKGPSEKEADGWERAPAQFPVVSWDPDTGRLIRAEAVWVWRGPAPDHMIRVTTASGRSLTVTPNHPFPVLGDDGEIYWKPADQLRTGQRIAAPTKIRIIETGDRTFHDDLIRMEGNYVRIGRALIRNWMSGLGLNKRAVAALFKVPVGRVNGWVQFGVLPLPVYVELSRMVGCPPSAKVPVVRRGKSVTTWLPLRTSDDLMEWFGMFLADGYINPSGQVKFFKEEERLLDRFRDLTQDLFGLDALIQRPNNRCKHVVVRSKALVSFLQAAFTVAPGKKKDGFDVPNWILGLPDSRLAAFLRGLFSCDASVGSHGVIELVTKSRALADSILYGLLRFNIVGRLLEKVVPNYPDRVYYRVQISGKNNIDRFLSDIGLTSDKRRRAILHYIQETTTNHSNVDTFPIETAIRRWRERTGMTQKAMAAALGVTRRAVSFYETGERALSRKVASRAAALIGLCPAAFSEDVFWDEIVTVERVLPETPFVYDLTVDRTHTFVAGFGGLVAHNTSLVNYLISLVPDDQRTITCEEVAEIQTNRFHHVAMESRPPNTEGRGEVTLRDLVINALRQRPDRVIVGECRAGEAWDMIQAMSTGHPGSMTTIHADDVHEAVERLVNMVLLAGKDLPVPVILRQIALAVDLFVQIMRLPDGPRKVVEVVEVAGVGEDGHPVLRPIYRMNYGTGLLEPTGLEFTRAAERARKYGVELKVAGLPGGAGGGGDAGR